MIKIVVIGESQYEGDYGTVTKEVMRKQVR